MSPIDDGYMEIPDRIAEFRERYPEGRLRPADEKRPYWFEDVDGKLFLVYAAACYRSPDDQLPGIGLAWEPVPGKTNFTRDSELQNAETSAWGRAIVAALASSSKKIATAGDVRNRRHEALTTSPPVPPKHAPPPMLRHLRKIAPAGVDIEQECLVRFLHLPEDCEFKEINELLNEITEGTFIAKSNVASAS